MGQDGSVPNGSVPTLPADLFSSFGRSIKSEVFELTAEDDTSFFVHKDILTYQSRPFLEATSGPWTEATDRKICLKDWDALTVARLVQFLYTGDYQYPDPAQISLSVYKPDVTDSEYPELIDDHPPPDERPLTPLAECVLLTCPPRPHNGRRSDSYRLGRSDTSQHNFNEPLLIHAKVYAIAHFKSIDALQALALERLSETLLKLNPLEPNSHISLNIVNLARYVYENTDSLSCSEEPLRKIISQYVALNFAAWQTEPEAVELIANGGQFVKDVMAKVCRRLMYQKVDVKEVVGPGKKFISKLRVVYQPANQYPPQGHVPEILCSTRNVSIPRPRGSKFYLVPEYTTTAKQACTHFEAVPSRGGCQSLFNSRDTIHSLEAVRSQDVLEKVTEVALVRSQKSFLSLGKIAGFDGITANINRDSDDGDYLYLVWKSVKTAPS